MHHADKLVAAHHLSRGPSEPAEGRGAAHRPDRSKEVLEADLAGEHDAPQCLQGNRARSARNVGDYVTMKLFEELLADRGRALGLPGDAARPQ